MHTWPASAVVENANVAQDSRPLLPERAALAVQIARRATHVMERRSMVGGSRCILELVGFRWVLRDSLWFCGDSGLETNANDCPMHLDTGRRNDYSPLINIRIGELNE